MTGDDEQRILIRALNDLRTDLINENRYTDPVDELIVKVTEAGPRGIMAAEKGGAYEYGQER